MDQSQLRKYSSELLRRDLWAGGEREYIGDCAECGVELWGYEDERDEEEEDEESELRCKRCGGDTLSKWDLMR